jgi:hypothetical protein
MSDSLIYHATLISREQAENLELLDDLYLPTEFRGYWWIWVARTPIKRSGATRQAIRIIYFLSPSFGSGLLWPRPSRVSSPLKLSFLSR